MSVNLWTNVATGIFNYKKHISKCFPSIKQLEVDIQKKTTSGIKVIIKHGNLVRKHQRILLARSTNTVVSVNNHQKSIPD